jgi:hypothetical protein
MKRLERYTPIAVDVVEDCFLNNELKAEKKTLKAVIDFGYLIRTSGLESAVVFFEKDKDKKKVLQGLQRILQIDKGETPNQAQRFSDLVHKNRDNRVFKKEVADATIALKLALRVYVDDKDNNEDGNEEDYDHED